MAVTGDGGFGQYLAELTTAVKYGMPSPTCCSTTASSARSPRSSAPGEYDVWQTSLHNPDFAAYARLCGAIGIRVHRADELDDAMKALFAADGPALLHVHADAELV